MTDQLTARRTADAVLTVLYRNHKGEVAVRRILPSGVWFGETQWHAGPRWFLHALDMGREVWRDFALAGLLAIGDDAEAAYLRREVDAAKLRAAEDSAARAAALRVAFHRACETYPAAHPMPESVQAWWQELYAVVVSSTAGLDVLAEIAKLRGIIDGLTARVAAQSDALSRAAEKDALSRLAAWREQDYRRGFQVGHRIVSLICHHGTNTRQVDVRLGVKPAHVGEVPPGNLWLGDDAPGALARAVEVALREWSRLFGED